MHHPTDRITHTTAFVTPVVEHWLKREIAQWVHPMKDRSDDPPYHERTLYLWATSRFPVKEEYLLIHIYWLCSANFSRTSRDKFKIYISWKIQTLISDHSIPYHTIYHIIYTISSVCLSVCLSVYLLVSIYISIYLYLYIYVCRSVCLSIYV